MIGNDLAFGGKTVILLRDFHQTGPVIHGGSQTEIVDASIKSSPLWPLFQIFTLIHAVRNAEDLPFSQWADNVSDSSSTEVPINDMLPIVYDRKALIDFVFPTEVLANPEACVNRSILAPTNVQINEYNDAILCEIVGDKILYLAADTVKERDETGIIYPDSILDYVAQTPTGLPHYNLVIKTNSVFRLLHNFSVEQQLVKNVRVVVTDVGTRLISVRLIRQGRVNSRRSEDILIPRISFSHQLPSGHTLFCKQFPLAPAYAATFNSCQGLTLDRVALDLTRPVFSHGQLYTALTRVRTCLHAIVRLTPGETTARNVMYNELLL